MTHVLLAGGAGFIGSHLTDRLLERGDSVVCVDDLSTGSRVHVDRHRDHPGHKFVQADVCDDALGARLPDRRFDAILHLACPASPSAYLARPLETLAAGSTGTRALLELALGHGARFLLASTSEVYGDPLVHPQPESYWGNVNPIGTRSVYDESKRFSESLSAAYARVHGVQVRIARIFNTYGPRMQLDDGRVVSNFVHQALLGVPLTIYGSGEQTRSFCYVDDLVSGLVALLDSDVDEPVNLGNPDEFTVQGLATIVIEMTGSSSTIEFRPLPSDDPQLRQPDISRARRTLGWEPTIPLADGLARTVEHVKAALAEQTPTG